MVDDGSQPLHFFGEFVFVKGRPVEISYGFALLTDKMMVPVHLCFVSGFVTISFYPFDNVVLFKSG